MSKGNDCFIALHIGAGFHSPAKEEQYNNICSRACRLGLDLLHSGKNSTEVVQQVCCLLEDSPLTNAGYGSNLSLDGLVECDAGIMESSTASFAAVACVKGVKNPIRLAKVLLDEQLSPHRLMPPVVLAGEGARQKAVSCGLELATNIQLTSPQAFKDHLRYKRVLELEDSEESTPKKIRLDSKTNEHSYGNSDDSFCNSNISCSGNEETTCCENKHCAENNKANVSNSAVESCCDNVGILDTEKHDKYTKHVISQHTIHTEVVNKNRVNKLTRNNNNVATIINPSSEKMLQSKTENKQSKHEHTSDKKTGVTPSVEMQFDRDIHSSLCEKSMDTNFLQMHEESKEMEPSALNDTIGVICVDNDLNIACGVSSGGIVLKHAGRVGHASHYGCACWAFQYSKDFSIACCTSGCGELLIRTGLAKKAAEHCLHKTDKMLNYNEFIEKKFLNSPYIKGISAQRLCGLLVVKLFKDEENPDEVLVDFQLAHTSESFCVSFMSGSMKKPQFILSRLEREDAGCKVVSQGFTLKL